MTAALVFAAHLRTLLILLPQAFVAVLDSTAYLRTPGRCLDFRTLPADHGSLVT